eukprot:6124140-Pleurochrysis_carterae.AAC.2
MRSKTEGTASILYVCQPICACSASILSSWSGDSRAFICPDDAHEDACTMHGKMPRMRQAPGLSALGSR